MKSLNRDILTKLFKKSKKIRIPEDFETTEFDNLIYYSWLDMSDMCLFMVYDFHETSMGLKLEVVRPPAGALRLGFCEFCKKHRKQSEVFFVSAETKKRPKGVEYQSRGTWVCSNYKVCNNDMKNTGNIDMFFARILELE